VRTIGAETPNTEVAVILGVDTHLDFHVAVALVHDQAAFSGMDRCS
jgi:hypothetical protein